MSKAKPIVLLFAFLFATLGGCFGPLMARQSMACCSSMPCSPAPRSMSCCTVNLPGAASYVQQSEKVSAPTLAYAVLAVLPNLSAAPVELSAALHSVGFHCDSPPGGLYTIHHSFLI
jgi:hypothetical protein